MLHPLLLAGLIIAVILYAALVRRRVVVRVEGRSLAAQMTASSEVALGRIGEAARRRSEALASAARATNLNDTDVNRRTDGSRRAPEVRA